MLVTKRLDSEIRVSCLSSDSQLSHSSDSTTLT